MARAARHLVSKSKWSPLTKSCFTFIFIKKHKISLLVAARFFFSAFHTFLRLQLNNSQRHLADPFGWGQVESVDGVGQRGAGWCWGHFYVSHGKMLPTCDMRQLKVLSILLVFFFPFCHFFHFFFCLSVCPCVSRTGYLAGRAASTWRPLQGTASDFRHYCHATLIFVVAV